MVKIVYNNMIIDVMPRANYVLYLPKARRYINSNKQVANAILGSNGNTIYHIAGTEYNFATELKSVQVVSISEKEYEQLGSQLMLQEQQNADLRQEVDELKKTINKQNALLEQLLQKL